MNGRMILGNESGRAMRLRFFNRERGWGLIRPDWINASAGRVRAWRRHPPTLAQEGPRGGSIG